MTIAAVLACSMLLAGCGSGSGSDKETSDDEGSVEVTEEESDELDYESYDYIEFKFAYIERSHEYYAFLLYKTVVAQRNNSVIIRTICKKMRNSSDKTRK